MPVTLARQKCDQSCALNVTVERLTRSVLRSGATSPALIFEAEMSLLIQMDDINVTNQIWTQANGHSIDKISLMPNFFGFVCVRSTVQKRGLSRTTPLDVAQVCQIRTKDDTWLAGIITFLDESTHCFHLQADPCRSCFLFWQVVAISESILRPW